MKPILLFSLILIISCANLQKVNTPLLPSWLKGAFSDDYDINYTITDSVFSMDGVAKYQILSCNEKEQYLLTRNDTSNKTDKGRYTRIDYMRFTGMEPYTWGFCLTVYDAVDSTTALQHTSADRDNPKKGCNGFPFSRMKALEK